MNDVKHLPTALVADDVSKLHDTGPGHPECAARFDAVMQKIKQADYTESLLHLKPRPAT